jgi:hypothetical protein
MGGSEVSRRVPATAFGGGIWGRVAAGIILPGPLREASSRHPRSALPNALEGTADA